MPPTVAPPVPPTRPPAATSPGKDARPRTPTPAVGSALPAGAVMWTGSPESVFVLNSVSGDRYTNTEATGVWHEGTVRYISGWGFDTMAGTFVAILWIQQNAGGCAADFNGDGFVTGDDFDAYVIEFIAGNLAADFNHDGFVTGDDFDAFVLAFEAGC